MPVIRINKLKPGMVLDKNVVDRTGRLLLTSGHEVTAKHIRTFKAWGITEVDVELVVEEQETTVSLGVKPDVVPEDIQKEIDVLFRYNDRRHPAIMELVDLCILRKVESRKEG